IDADCLNLHPWTLLRCSVPMVEITILAHHRGRLDNGGLGPSHHLKTWFAPQRPSVRTSSSCPSGYARSFRFAKEFGPDQVLRSDTWLRMTALAAPTTTFFEGSPFSIQISASTRSSSSYSVAAVTRPRHVMRSPCCTPPFMNVSEMRLPLIQWCPKKFTISSDM